VKIHDPDHVLELAQRAGIWIQNTEIAKLLKPVWSVPQLLVLLSMFAIAHVVDAARAECEKVFPSSVLVLPVLQ
jgi:hypothetical protein